MSELHHNYFLLTLVNFKCLSQFPCNFLKKEFLSGCHISSQQFLVVSHVLEEGRVFLLYPEVRGAGGEDEEEIFI